MMMSYGHDIVWYHCKGFLMLAGPSGGSTTPHSKHSDMEKFSLWAPLGWWCSRALMPGFSPTTTCCIFRRGAHQVNWVLSPLCKLTRLNFKNNLLLSTLNTRCQVAVLKLITRVDRLSINNLDKFGKQDFGFCVNRHITSSNNSRNTELKQSY